MRQRERACSRVAPNIKVERDAIHFGNQLVVFLRRTLRVPDVPESIEAWPLPPNLGAFPLRRVHEYRDRVPRDWSGVFVPVRAREALWLDFYARSPHAVKVGVGGVNAVTGGRWREGLHAPQDYLVCPPQDWLDGVRTREGRVRQFVAVPLGEGYTVESQLTGEERRGGIDIVVYPPKPGRKLKAIMGGAAGLETLGVAAGGEIEQRIHPDPHGIGSWDQSRPAAIRVHLIEAAVYREWTGEDVPYPAPTAEMYTAAGLPWFERLDEEFGDLPASAALSRVQSVSEIDRDRGASPDPSASAIKIDPPQLLRLKTKNSRRKEAKRMVSGNDNRQEGTR